MPLLLTNDVNIYIMNIYLNKYFKCINAYHKMVFWNEGRGNLLFFQIIKFAQFYNSASFYSVGHFGRKGRGLSSIFLLTKCLVIHCSDSSVDNLR